MSRPEPAPRQVAQLLEAVVAVSDAHRAAAHAEIDRREARDDAIVQAVRAGARLEEIAGMSAISRAAVSKAVRRVLPGRTGRGGPYSRRRGSAAALVEIAKATQALTLARQHSSETKRRRDEAIGMAMRRGALLSQVARAAGLSQASVSTIARSTVIA